MAGQQTTEWQVDDLADAMSSLQPLSISPELTSKAKTYFDVYAQGKSLDDWFDHEVVMVHQLSRLSCLIDDLFDEMDTHGKYTTTSSGNTVAHPRMALLKDFLGIEKATIRALRLAVKDGRKMPPKRSDTTKRAAEQKKKRNVMGFDRGNLLAKPD